MTRLCYVMHPLMFLVVVVGANNTTPLEKDRKLVEILRRQLMNNNYDYMEDSGDSDQLTTQHPDELPVILKRDGRDPGDEFNEDYHAHDLDNKLSENVNQEDPTKTQVSARYLSRRNEPTNDDDDNDEGSRFYEDDNHLDTRRLIKNHDKTLPTSTTVRYKVLEVLEPHSGRRSGLAKAHRRFLQEETPDHIAIVPLDEGPIPEFRLPRNRRQYMGDYDRWELPENPENAVLAKIGYTTSTAKVARRNRAPVPMLTNETEMLIQQKNTEEQFYGSLEPDDSTSAEE